MKIRHLILTSSFAGAEQHVCTLASEQSRHGHEVEVWGGDPTAMRGRLAEGVVHRACSSVAVAVRHARKAPRPDVLHAHMTKAELASTLISGATGPPVISTRHFAAVRGRSRGGHLARPLLRRRFTVQLAVSEYVAAHIDGPSRVVYAGVESQTFDQPRERVVLVAQRLSPEKRTGDALASFATSGLVAQGWHMDIAGRGHEYEALKRQAVALGLSGAVRFLGFCDDLRNRLATAAIVLATAPAEPFGLTVVEAMAHGTSVVASASGGHLESVGRATSDFLYAVGNTHRAGDLLAQLASDEERRRGYGEKLRDVQRSLFTLERQYLNTQAVYEELSRG